MSEISNWVVIRCAICVAGMEKEGKSSKTRESEFVLQWGNKKRLRCQKVKVKKERSFDNNTKSKRIKDSPSPLPQRINK